MRITSIVLVLLIAGSLYYWFVGRHGDAPPTLAAVEKAEGAKNGGDKRTPEAPAESRDQAPVPVVAITSTARQTTARLVLRGRTLASRNVKVAAETTGRVISEPLRRGTAVRKGDVLCRLDPGIRAAQLTEAEAALAEARVESEAATRLKSKGFAAETTMRARQAQLQAAQARLDRVRWDIERLEIRAPFNGFLESDTAELGALLSPGGICANVIDLSQIKVTGFVAEQEVDQLRVGQKATARLINGVVVEGSLSFISRVADAQTRTFSVEVTIPNADGRLRDGMTAELLIDLPGGTGHLLPQSALTLNDDGELGVRIDDNGIARFVKVRILRDQDDGFWVAGLPDTAKVIVIGQEFVTDGRRVISSAPAWALGK